MVIVLVAAAAALPPVVGIRAPRPLPLGPVLLPPEASETTKGPSRRLLLLLFRRAPPAGALLVRPCPGSPCLLLLLLLLLGPAGTRMEERSSAAGDGTRSPDGSTLRGPSPNVGCRPDGGSSASEEATLGGLLGGAGLLLLLLQAPFLLQGPVQVLQCLFRGLFQVLAPGARGPLSSRRDGRAEESRGHTRSAAEPGPLPGCAAAGTSCGESGCGSSG